MNNIASPSSEVVCKHCQSKNVRKYGLYKTTQIYYCNDCKRKFNADDHLFKMKTPANQVSSWSEPLRLDTLG
jgi:transposase-like protein